MRFTVVLALLAAVAGPLAVRAEAGERHNHSRAIAPDRAFSGPGYKFRQPWQDRNFQADHRHHHSHSPSVVFISPGRCWQAGYWTYQWIPQSYSYNAWVAGHWSPEGTWVEGHYTPAWYNGGYYQPYWVEGYWARC